MPSPSNYRGSIQGPVHLLLPWCPFLDILTSLSAPQAWLFSYYLLRPCFKRHLANTMWNLGKAGLDACISHLFSYGTTPKLRHMSHMALYVCINHVRTHQYGGSQANWNDPLPEPHDCKTATWFHRFPSTRTDTVDAALVGQKDRKLRRYVTVGWFCKGSEHFPGPDECARLRFLTRAGTWLLTTCLWFPVGLLVQHDYRVGLLRYSFENICW